MHKWRDLEGQEMLKRNKEHREKERKQGKETWNENVQTDTCRKAWFRENGKEKRFCHKLVLHHTPENSSHSALVITFNYPLSLSVCRLFSNMTIELNAVTVVVSIHL